MDVPKATLAQRQTMKPSSPSTRSSTGAGGEAKVQNEAVIALCCQGKEMAEHLDCPHGSVVVRTSQDVLFAWYSTVQVP